MTALAAVVLVMLALLVGLVLAVYQASVSVTRMDDTGERAAGGGRPQPSQLASRDGIAAEPMLQVQPADAKATAPAPTPGPTIQIPPSTRTGPAGVPAGFPHTPEGAVGQLAAIGTAVLQAMSISHTNEVYTHWAMPGGVGVERWRMTENVQAFLSTAQISQEKNLSVTVVAIPAAAQIKGTDGGNWVVACVLFDVRATISVDARMGYGYCERMQWHKGRWLIGPGTPPAKAPSTWPGSELSIKAGWRSWVDVGEG